MDDAHAPMRAESLNELLRAESLNIRRALKESHNMPALYEPADLDQPATAWAGALGPSAAPCSPHSRGAGTHCRCASS